MKKSKFKRFIRNKYTIMGAIVLAIILYFVFRHRNGAPTFEFTATSIGDVVQEVSVTGTVSPVDKADLAFQKSGVISKIPVKVGNQVKKGDLIASLDSAADSAALDSAKATLADLSRGLRPEEYAADQSAVNSASTTLANAESDAVNAVRTGYIQAQGAVVNYADAFFTNPQTVNPMINIRVESTPLQISINNELLLVSDALDKWKADSNAAITSNVAGFLSNAEGYLALIKNLMNDLSDVVNDLTPANAGITQQVIDADVATMNTALSNTNQSMSTLLAAETELKNASSAYAQAQNAFALQQAGTSPDAIAAQAAKVAQAQAELDDDAILSPIDGIVTKADPNMGEFAAAGQSGFTVQNNGFKVEAYVPEADIAKVSVGDLASSTLDAFGSYVDFPEQVALIDPAETVLEGVPTYKVTLYFVTPDSRIRSGMTANLEILTHEADNVLEIPYRAITLNATSTTVRVVNADGKTYVSKPVVVGLKGSDGTIVIVSGLKAGDKVVTYVQQ